MATAISVNGRAFRRKAPGPSYVGGGGFGNLPPLWSDGETNEPTGFHLASYAEIYETQPVVAAAVNLLFRQMATLPLKVFKRAADNSRERVVDHPLSHLFEAPCPRKSAVNLLEWIALPLLVHGNALVFKYRTDTDSPVSQLYPLDWAHISAYAQQGGPVEWWGTTQFGEERYVKAEEVLHFAWNSPGSEIGVSPLKHLGTTLKIEDAAQRHTVTAFKHGVNPSFAVILHPDARLDDESRDLMRKNIEKIHGGPENQGRVFLAGHGSDVKTLSHTAREAELIAVRDVTEREICMVYNVKPTVLGDLKYGTYSNIIETNQDFYKGTLRPWLAMIEATLSAQLVRDEPAFQGVFPEFDTSEQLKGNPLERFQSYALQITNGIRSINEIRALENLPPDDSPEADKLWVEGNNLQTIDQAASVKQLREEMAGTPPDPSDGQPSP